MKLISFFVVCFLFSQNVHSQLCEPTIPSADWDNIVKFKPALNDANNAAAHGNPVRSIFDASALGDKVNLDYWV